MTLAESLSRETLWLRLRDTEHDFVERKPKNQQGEWLQVAVAFANSAPIGFPAILFAGADDSGNPQYEANQLEDAAKSLAGTLDRAFPSIYRHVVPLIEGEKGCLAVVIPGSENRPHFAGRSYIRVGPEIKEASEEQITLLVEDRISKVRLLRKWIDRSVTLTERDLSPIRIGYIQERMDVSECNQFYLTLRSVGGSGAIWFRSIPLNRLNISFDHDKERLEIEVLQGP